MQGWTGNILRVNLSEKTSRKETFSQSFAEKWVGGRGFALQSSGMSCNLAQIRWGRITS